MPVILWQVWAFFIPAFDKSHERMLKAFVFLSSVLLVAGVVFGYFVALPAAVTFLTNYDNNVYTVLIRARDYLSFATKVLLAMALVFELPIFVIGLTRLGILTTEKLRKNRRIGYFIVACIGVALPGVDPVTTVFETIPLGSPVRGLDLAVRLPRPALARAEAAVAEHVTERQRGLGAARRRAADPRRARPLRRRPDRRGDDGPRRAPPRRRGDHPRASSTRTRTSSTRSMPGSATARRSGRGSARTCSARPRSTRDGMLAVARRGAWDSLASGITTTADYSFSGAAATAAAEAGPARDRLPRGLCARARGRRAPVRREARAR